jgi:hypothetical protein
VSERTRTTGKPVLAALVCGAALLASGCGSDDEGQDLPKSSVDSLRVSLDSIQRRFEEGDGACRDITQGDDTDVAVVKAKLDALPADVDKDVRDALVESFQNLFDLIEEECGQAETETETAPPETTPTVTETVPTVTETVPTETTPTETTTTPDNQGNGNGNGNGGGGGAKAPKEK